MPKPKPFVRPSIDLTPHHREWRNLRPTEVRTGDTVAGIGLVKEVYPGVSRATFINVLGIKHEIPNDGPSVLVLTEIPQEVS